MFFVVRQDLSMAIIYVESQYQPFLMFILCCFMNNTPCCTRLNSSFCFKGPLVFTHNLLYNYLILYRYWPGRSWNITFWWTAKRVIFSQGIIFSQSAQHWGKYCPEGKYNYLGTTDTWYFIRPGRYLLLDGQNEWFPQNLMCSTTTTKFGNKIRSLRTKQIWTQTWQLARILLWCSIVNHCILCVHGAFLSGSVS